MKKVLGLDIGISCVGWGVIDQDSGDIIDAGVRLFKEVERNANVLAPSQISKCLNKTSFTAMSFSIVKR